MILFEDAKNTIIDMAQSITLGLETMAVTDVHGRVCGTDIYAPCNIQPFDNSAMDGFAVRTADIQGASPQHPIALQKIETVFAGTIHNPISIQAGQCVHIMTGAPMVGGADAVVPIEHTLIQGDTIYFKSPTAPTANIRHAGADFRQGDKVLKQGDILTTAHILPLTTLGISTIQVYTKPKISVITSGDELVNDITVPLQNGQIYNANAPYICALIRHQGGDIIHNDTIPDSVDDFIATIQKSMADGVHIIVSSGAVSAGKSDFVAKGLRTIGADILYHKIQMRPGKPNLFARLPNGALYFGLPGNPVASAVGVRFFVDCAIKTMTHHPPQVPMYAISTTAFHKNHDFCMFLKGMCTPQADGHMTVHIMDKQASFMVSPFLHINCWVYTPENRHTIQTGDMVHIYPFFDML